MPQESFSRFWDCRAHPAFAPLLLPECRALSTTPAIAARDILCVEPQSGATRKPGAGGKEREMAALVIENGREQEDRIATHSTDRAPLIPAAAHPVTPPGTISPPRRPPLWPW
jgi:hypothetical protein